VETRPVEDEIDLFELFQKLYQERWLILGITAITTLITLLVSFLIPKTYKAEAFFEIPTFQTYQPLQNTSQNIQIINYPELSEAFKSYEKYRKFPFKAKISQIRNSSNIGKIEVEGSSPEEAKKNLSEVINIINKELFSEKLNVIKENLNKRINAIDITIKEFISKGNNLYDPTKIADLLTEKERIQKWLQNPQIISPLDIIVSSEPVRPKPLLYTAIGFITGIFLGIFVALIKEAIKSRT
jgi:LPS O-antigen subunit length determinant protein (WzzB/FepE family)